MKTFAAILPVLFAACCLTAGLAQGPAIVQSGKTIALEAGQSPEINLKPQSFELQFSLTAFTADKPYALQAAFLATEEAWNTIQTGLFLESTPCFKEGMGLAAYTDGYHCIFMADDSNHYIFFEQKGEQRARLLSRNPDGSYRLSWTINKICGLRKDKSLKKVAQPLLMCLLFDRNLNGTIDAGEWYKARIVFKK